MKKPHLELERVSKRMSLLLRHAPERAGLTLDDAGWISVAELLAGLERMGSPVDRATLDEVVRTSDKQRFALSPDGAKIRANQGHSIEVELGHERREPPAALYHGTVARFLDSIRAQGLVRGERHHVHLSDNLETATRVGARRGAPVVLSVRASDMARDGHVFYRSENGVWLTDAVPPQYLVFPQG